MGLGRHMVVRQRPLVCGIRRHALLNHGLLHHGLLWHGFRKRHPLRGGHRLSGQGLRWKDTLWRHELLVMMWRDLDARRHALLLLLLLRRRRRWLRLLLHLVWHRHMLGAGWFLRRWST